MNRRPPVTRGPVDRRPEGDAVDRLLVDHLVDDPQAGVGDLVEALRRRWPDADVSELGAAAERARARSSGLGAIEPLLELPDVTEIMINGCEPVWVEQHGSLRSTEVRLDAIELDVLVSRILDPLGLRVDRLHPMADGRLPDGSRVNVVIPPLSIDGPVITIRRFRARAVGLDEFAPPDIVEQLGVAVERRRTIVVSGATGAGKTTLLNALARFVPDHERIVTIEDTAELALGMRHCVRLEARRPNAEQVGEVTIRDLVRNALRMRPDRLVIGETRGPDALDLLMALSTGHRGSFTTVHAHDPDGALRRLQLLASLADSSIAPSVIADLIIDTVDLVIHVERRGDRRSIVAVARVADDPGLRTVPLWSTR